MTRLVAVVLLVAAGAAPDQSRPASPPQSITRLAILGSEAARASNAGDVRVLLEAARSENPSLQAAAVRALGRLERRDLIADIVPFLSSGAAEVRAEAANALAQALRGEPPDTIPASQQEQAVLEALLAAGATEMQSRNGAALGAIARSAGRLRYHRPDQVRAAEAFLRRVLDRSRGTGDQAWLAAAARGLESLGRLNRRLAPLEDDTLRRLRAMARSAVGPDSDVLRRNVLAALVASQGVDDETLTAALDDSDVQVRRLATVALAGAGARMTAPDRVAFIRDALGDTAAMVRYEAIRAWVRHGISEHGCQPLVDALNDASPHVVLASLDALGEHCEDDQSITDRLTSEARTPPTIGSWHRETHAFVALARRAPDRAAVAMPAFSMHQVWQVRLYAARAAAAMTDVATLVRLAGDEDDNVAEAALPVLRRRLGAESEPALVAALNRRNRAIGRGAPARPYSLIRTAAMELEGMAASAAILQGLTEALTRITLERCETSRDTRLALIDRLRELGSVAQAGTLQPLLRDIDPVVARAAARLLGEWTGKVHGVDPVRQKAQVPSESELAPGQTVVVEMGSGRQFRMALLSDQAPLSAARFLQIVKAGAYDGTTFHRVEPNFVIQGGSPGGNEYCGDCPFMRDEVGLLMHERGTVGISTRGRDTGDAQIFINLVDNPRLDHAYTVFAQVAAADLDVVDGILEGDRILRIRPAN